MANRSASRFAKIHEALEHGDYYFLNRVICPTWDSEDLATSAKNYETMLRDAVAWAMEFPGRKIMTIHVYLVCPIHDGKDELDELEKNVDSKICQEFGLPDLERFREKSSFSYH